MHYRIEARRRAGVTARLRDGAHPRRRPSPTRLRNSPCARTET